MRGEATAVLMKIIFMFLLIAPLPCHARDLEIWGVWADGSSGTGTLIRGPNGTVVLFDEGGGAIWASHCKSLMDDEGIGHIDYAIAGHYDRDHVGGLNDLWIEMGSDHSHFGTYYDRGGSVREDGSPIPSDYYDLVTAPEADRATVVLDGSSDIHLGSGAIMKFLSVGASDEPADLREALYIRGHPDVTTSISENNKSISVLITYGDFDIYLGSDLEGSGEKAVDDVVVDDLGRGVDILLVDHHGSDTNGISSPEFFENMSPEVAFISVWNNGFGHPRRTTVVNLQEVVEADDQRIIRLTPGDPDDPLCAPEGMLYCHTTERHLYITTNGSTYTVDTIERPGGEGNDITDPDLIDHPTDEGRGGPVWPWETSAPPLVLMSKPVVINEVAWGGTAASDADEWIELKNNTRSSINLAGWKLYEGGGATEIITLTGTIEAGGYYLIERTDDSTVSDILGDIYGPFGGSGLSISGEHLQLRTDSGILRDEVNCSGGWFAGTASPDFYTMERKDPTVSGNLSSNWASNDGITRNGLDANDDPLNGTPRGYNSALSGRLDRLPGPPVYLPGGR